MPHAVVVSSVTLLCVALLLTGCPAPAGPDPVVPPGTAEPSAARPTPTPPTATAEASSPESTDSSRSALTVRLTLASGDDLVLDGKRLADLDALEARLLELASTRSVELVLVVSPGVLYARLVEIMDCARRAGITDVLVVPATATSPPVDTSGDPTVSSATPPPNDGATSGPVLPRTSSGNAAPITPPVSLPPYGSPEPITPPLLPQQLSPGPR